MDSREEALANDPRRTRARDPALEEEADEAELLETLIELQGDAAWVEARDGTVPFATRGCEKLFGRRREALFARPDGWLDFVHPDDRPALEAALARLRTRPGPEMLPVRIMRPDGTTATARVSLLPQPAPRGGFACSLREVAPASDAGDRLQRVLNRLFAFVAIIAPDGTLLEVNRASLDLGGRRRTDVIGRHFADASWFAHSPAIREQVRDALHRAAAGETVRFDLPNVTAGGALLVVDAVFAPVVENGRVIEIVASGVDVTDRQRAQDAVQELNDELEARVRERTDQLAAAQQALVRKERLATLGQLTATVSHELRNPLGTMRLALHTLRQQLSHPTASQQRLLERLDRGITRCDHIIDELLDYTRIRDLAREPTLVDAWLGDVLDELPHPPGITVHRDFGAPGVRAAIDPDRLRRAVINVAENAFHAIQAGDRTRGTLEVATRARDGTVELAFTDDGGGIPPDVLGLIFEPLFSTKIYGVGLGLPVVRRILEQHDGRVEITSRPGVGTRVVFRLPVLPVLPGAAGAAR